MAYRQRDPKREAFWREALVRQRQSGLSLRRWCSTQGVTESALHYWRATLAKRDRHPLVPDTPAFLPLVLSAPGREQPERISLRLRGGRMMHLPMGMGVEQLAALVHAIEGPSSAGEGTA
jgi:hypothetical protein